MSTGRTYRFFKRLIDILVSGGALVVSGPVIVGAGLLVKIDSTGPMFYRSRRVGLGWKPFDLLKLRTMTANQETGRPQVTSGADDRITRVGSWLRKTKLDELPQFFNVLVGDVSLVGPRPEVEPYAAHFREQYDRILSVKPGLSDRATLQFVDEESVLAEREDTEAYYLEEVLPNKIELYLRYIDNPGFFEDIAIIALTAAKVGERFTRQLVGRR